jgi:hypothetical protein
MSRVALAALVYFGPLAVGLTMLLLRRWLHRRHARRQRIPVAVLIARIERERLTAPTFRLPSRTPGLPPGWRWPLRDPDRSPCLRE